MRSQRQFFRGHVLSRLLRDQRGALITIVGLAIIPLFGAVGLAIDASRAYLAKSRLWSAVDAAALAGGRVYSSDTRDDDVRMYFESNFPDGFMGADLEPLEIVPDDVNRTITVTARATIPTTFMRVLGTEVIPIAASSEVTLEASNIEVSLVLDITGSMAGSRIVDLRDAANQLVDMVVQDVQEPFYSKLALVPYSIGVNVDSYATQVRGPYTEDATCTEPDEPSCEYYRFENADHDWTTHQISTCVTERTGPDAYTDAPPSAAFLGRNFPAPGSYNPCPENTIVPLTSNRTLLHGEIDALDVAGSTAGHIGVAWGWYMLSPNFAYLWDTESQPAAYDAEDLIKVAIIMTDGEFNTVYYNGVIAENSTSGSGSDDYKINEDSLNGSSDDQALQLCTAMKAAGIVVYTVGLDIEGTSTEERLEQCATEPDYAYFPEDGEELKQHFRAIAMKVSALRLSK